MNWLKPLTGVRDISRKQEENDDIPPGSQSVWYESLSNFGFGSITAFPFLNFSEVVIAIVGC
jgi:hypothetical protein